MTTAEVSYEYHLRVVSDAIQSSRNRGAAINTVSLSGFNLPYYHEWEVPELSTLLESLGKLLQSVRVIRLSDSSSPLEVLSRCALRSIGFHDVTITESSRLVSPSGLSSDMLCKMMKVPQSSLCRAAVCRFGKKGGECY